VLESLLPPRVDFLIVDRVGRVERKERIVLIVYVEIEL